MLNQRKSYCIYHFRNDKNMNQKSIPHYGDYIKCMCHIIIINISILYIIIINIIIILKV